MKKNPISVDKSTNTLYIPRQFRSTYISWGRASMTFGLYFFYTKGVIQMICETIRKGAECAFMTKAGCSYKEGLCHEIVDRCDGCSRTAEFASRWYCTSFPEPSVKWRNGNCTMASHVASTVSANKQKLNPLKASKRGKR